MINLIIRTTLIVFSLVIRYPFLFSLKTFDLNPYMNVLD